MERNKNNEPKLNKTCILNRNDNLDNLINLSVRDTVVGKIKGGLNSLLSNIDNSSKIKSNIDLLEHYLFLLEWFSDSKIALTEVKTLFKAENGENIEKLLQHYMVLASYKLEDYVVMEFKLGNKHRMNAKQKVLFRLLKKFIENESISLDLIELVPSLDLSCIKNLKIINIVELNKLYGDIMEFLKHKLSCLKFNLKNGGVLLENTVIEGLLLFSGFDNLLRKGLKIVLDKNSAQSEAKKIEESIKSMINISLKSSTKSLSRFKRIIEAEFIYRIQPLLTINSEHINKLKNLYNFTKCVLKLGYLLLKLNWGTVNVYFLFCLGQLMKKKWDLIETSNKFLFFKSKSGEYTTKLFHCIKDLKLLTLSAFLYRLSVSFKDMVISPEEERYKVINSIKFDMRKLFKEKISGLVSKTDNSKIKEDSNALLNIYLELKPSCEKKEKLILDHGYKEIKKFYSASFLMDQNPKSCIELDEKKVNKIKEVKEVDNVIDLCYGLRLKGRPGYSILLNSVELLLLGAICRHKIPIDPKIIQASLKLPLPVVKETLTTLLGGGILEKIGTDVKHFSRGGRYPIKKLNYHREGLEILCTNIYSKNTCFDKEELKTVIHIFNGMIIRGYFEISTLDVKDKRNISVINKMMEFYKNIVTKTDQTRLKFK
eukprot:GAHX01002413.1.p1 GENE.GAHX01002413.1~~GAHX01002413.1.p1  ORF type:complete len:655 (+),score=135.94 GAHX01002413.1:159-2123(+)